MRALSLIVSLVVGSCATKGGGHGVAKEKTFSVWLREDAPRFRRAIAAPIDSVWRFVPSTFQALRFPGAASVYADDYAYLTPTLKIERQLYQGESNSLYLNCGFTPAGLPVADAYPVTFAIFARLLPQSSGATDVEIMIDGTAKDPVEHRTALRCDGTGRLEAMVFKRLEALVSGGANVK